MRFYLWFVLAIYSQFCTVNAHAEEPATLSVMCWFTNQQHLNDENIASAFNVERSDEVLIQFDLDRIVEMNLFSNGLTIYDPGAVFKGSSFTSAKFSSNDYGGERVRLSTDNAKDGKKLEVFELPSSVEAPEPRETLRMAAMYANPDAKSVRAGSCSAVVIATGKANELLNNFKLLHELKP